MSIHIDRKFLLFLSPKLERFAQKKPDLYNFRCPICGDSQKNKAKARGFIFKKKNDYYYMCHNCGAGHTFYNFLKLVDSSLLNEYTLERYKNGESGNANYPKPEFNEFKTKQTFQQKPKSKIALESVDSLPDTHCAKVYVESRMIPKEFQKELYYAEDFKGFVESMGIEKEKLFENDPRLVIPFYNEKKELIAFQGRTLNGSKVRYVTVTVEEDIPKFFGLDKIDKSKKVYVVEGPIDSMFLPNAIATADASLSRVGLLNLKDVTLVYDNEPRNKDIVRQISKAIDEGFSVCLFPETIDYKDINDQILDGISASTIKTTIDRYTYKDLRAKLEFSNWKKT